MALQMRLSQRERGGCFRDCVGAAGSSPWRRDALLAGAAVLRIGGLPPSVFYVVFFVQSSRSRTAARPVRGAAEGCVSSRSRPTFGAAWPWLSGILVCSLGKAQTRQPACASRRIKSHLSDPRIMQSMLLLLACSAVALLPAPARQHRGRALQMGWGDPPVWSEATIKSNTEACAGHRAIELEVPKETADAFETAGQYVQLTIGEEKPGFYAIASAPGKATFEFLIKENEGNAYLTSLKSGAPVKCSEVSGKGYQTKEHFDGDGGAVAAQYDGFACMNVLFVAGGSGVAPLRSCIEAGVALELPQRATLYYGVRDDSVLAYQDKFDEWSKDYNVDVVTCFSQGSGGAFKGYVQDAIKAKGVAVPRNTGAAVCGPKDMFTATKELLTKEGVFESRVLSNF